MIAPAAADSSVCLDDPAALQLLAFGARTKGRTLAVESLRSTVDVCAHCAETIAFDDDGEAIDCCDGAGIAQVAVWSPKVVLGLLDGSRRSLELQGLVLPAHLVRTGEAS